MKKEFKNLTVDNLIKTDWFNQFDKQQKKLIIEGLQENLDVFLYAKTKYSWGQMAHLKAGLKKNLDISLYANPEFNNFQMNEIRLGLQNSLDVSVYAKPEIDFKEMKKIRLELLKKIKKRKRDFTQ